MSRLYPPQARPRPGRRAAALAAVTLVAASWILVGRMAAEAEATRPFQASALVFGPGPAAPVAPAY